MVEALIFQTVRGRTLLVLALLVPVAGCFGGEPSARDALIPYPRLGDVAVYDVQGAMLDFGRWENGAPFASGTGQVRFSVADGPEALDGARALHKTYLVTVERNSGGGFVKHADRYVSARHSALVQSYFPLSQAQGVVSFDERGFPWLWGASALFGADPSRESAVAFTLPDNLGRAGDIALRWVVVGVEDGATRFDLEGNASIEASLWFAPGSPWPTRAVATIHDAGLAPHVQAASYPARMEAQRVSIEPGTESVPARDRAARFIADEGVLRVPWDGEKPPDGDASYASYLLADAVRDAKLFDRGLAAWLETADDPRLYRGTFQEEAGTLAQTVVPVWLLQFVDATGAYYEVEMERVTFATAGQGVPVVAKSGPAQAPTDPNHGWFPADAVPPSLVPLSEGARIVRDVFGATGVQVFLRSFTDPPGYSYFLDGGWEVEGGRYTVVYNPSTGFIEQATGPVTARLR